MTPGSTNQSSPIRWGPLLTALLTVTVLTLGVLSLRQHHRLQTLEARELLSSPSRRDRQTMNISPNDSAGRNWEAKLAAQMAGGVCLIQGEYMFVEPQSEKPLRYANNTAAADAGSQPQPLSLNGAGEPMIVHYTGSGFLIDAEGYIATNKHVASPWTAGNQWEYLLAAGYEPRRCLLRAFFPGQVEAVGLTIAAEAENDDITLLRAQSLPPSVPVLTCAADHQVVRVGQTVILLGYPTGFDGLLARLDDDELAAIIGTEGLSFEQMALRMAQRGLIEPVATRGMCGRVGKGMLVYDAQTAIGGSGGPVITEDGCVVAINTALMKSFAGSNFGMNIKGALDLLANVKSQEKLTAQAQP
ncbi:MAG: trypsin-like peptidase domain-containing protein [Sedimentisphaerales bacterium]|nr:trypsin-like peptidase domain-containing protein [Sedimentisphaerales bacterium]